MLKRLLSLCLIISLPFITGSRSLPIESSLDFHLYSNNQFFPGDFVTVKIYGHGGNSEKMNYRLLRVKDPVEFFTSFKKNKPLYDFDIWDGSRITLDNTELVKEWSEEVSFIRNYLNSDVKAGVVDKPGFYILQVMNDNKVAYCGIVVSKYTIAYKKSPTDMLAFLADAKTGKFIKDATLYIYTEDQFEEKLTPDTSGLFSCKIKEGLPQNTLSIFAETKDEVVVSNAYMYGGYGNSGTAYVYTNQPVYRPGQTGYFKATIRGENGDEYIIPPTDTFKVKITSPKQKVILNTEITSNSYGSLSGSFTLSAEADLGYYNIQIIKDEKVTYYGSFSVEEYKKPEFEVTVETDKNNYAAGDEIKGKVKAMYYFGSPVSGGTVTLNVYKSGYWRPWYYYSDYYWFYSDFENKRNMPGYGATQVTRLTGTLNKEGEFEFSYTPENDGNSDYIYYFKPEVTDLSRRVINGSGSVYVTRGSFLVSVSAGCYFYGNNEPVRLRVNTADILNNPVSTKFQVEITYPDGKEKETLYGETGDDGKTDVYFMSKYNQPGSYKCVVTAYDEKERMITASSYFYIGSQQDYFYGRQYNNIEIVTDKDAYEKGDTLSAFICLPEAGAELLLTFETSTFVRYQKVVVDGTVFAAKEILDDKYSGGVTLSVLYIKNKALYQNSKMVGVLDKDKFLNIDLKPGKNKYKPGEEVQYNIKVTDNKGKPVVGADLSLGIIDESIYAIKEDRTIPIRKYFYRPKYHYIPYYSSLSTNYNGRSRLAMYADKTLAGQNTKSTEGESSLSGKIDVKLKNYDGITLILENKENLYTVQADTLGNYKFKNIVEGDYTLYINYNKTIEQVAVYVKVDGEAALNIKPQILVSKAVDKVVDQDQVSHLPVRGVSQLSSLQSGTVGGVDYSLTEVNIEGKGLNSEVATNTVKTIYAEAEVRSNFVDALFWKPDILTDNNGEANVSFKMSDNLTAWRATVKGVTANTMVGENTDKIISRKDLLVRMETPRFFREDDELVISTIVHNYLSEDKKSRISFTADNLKLTGSQINTPGYSTIQYDSQNGMYELRIAKNSEVRIDWRVKAAIPLGTAKLKAEALTDEESDAMEVSVPVYPKGYKVSIPLAATIEEDSSVQQVKFNIPDGTDLRSSSFSLRMDASLTSTVLKALDELVQYPYGCVEQTMSRFLPALMAANTFKQLNIPVSSKTMENIPRVVDSSLSRLYNFQKSEGGWGWWMNDESNPYMTAYVVYGLILAQSYGFNVEPGVLEKGVISLSRQVVENKNIDNKTQFAYQLFALSTVLKHRGMQGATIVKKIKEFEAGEDPYTLALLSLAAFNLGEKELVAGFNNKLISKIKEDRMFAYWGYAQDSWWWYNDDVQTTSFVLKALLQEERKDIPAEKVIRWMMSKKQGYSWRSTQETASIIFALTDYLKKSNELNPDYNAAVYVNGKKAADNHFTAADVYSGSKEFSIDNSLLQHGVNVVEIKKEGKGKLYFSGINNYYTSGEVPAAEPEDFTVRREYYLLKPIEKEGHIFYEKTPFKGKVTTGENIFVRTTVESKNGGLQYFMLEDMLPSGFEIVRDQQQMTILDENDYRYGDDYGWRPWRWFYADREYRDEKVSFFVTNTSPKMEFSYIIKAQIPGSYNTAPAEASLMYYPEYNGHSGITNIRVLDK